MKNLAYALLCRDRSDSDWNACRRPRQSLTPIYDTHRGTEWIGVTAPYLLPPTASTVDAWGDVDTMCKRWIWGSRTWNCGDYLSARYQYFQSRAGEGFQWPSKWNKVDLHVQVMLSVNVAPKKCMGASITPCPCNMSPRWDLSDNYPLGRGWNCHALCVSLRCWIAARPGVDWRIVISWHAMDYILKYIKIVWIELSTKIHSLYLSKLHYSHHTSKDSLLK